MRASRPRRYEAAVAMLNIAKLLVDVLMPAFSRASGQDSSSERWPGRSRAREACRQNSGPAATREESDVILSFKVM
jgi:hypothetical protein